jgi:serine/threonine protein kinase
MIRTVLPWLLLFILGILLSPVCQGTDSVFGLVDAGQRTGETYSIQQRPTGPQEAPASSGRVKKPIRALLSENAEAITLYVTWAVGAPILIVGIVICMLLRPRRKERDAPPEQPVTATMSSVAPPPRAPRTGTRKAHRPKPAAKLSEKVQLMRFFLQLFKSQQQVDPEAPAQIVRVETRPTCPDETYEMRILDKEEWIARRMSLGLLGQGGGSRSQCFYVIYDTHMVVKIPPAPMTRFEQYKRQIAAEGLILARLAPRLCIVPRISVILKMIHRLEGEEQLSEEMVEERYAALLEDQPEFQEYLKIDDSFAFFMDLAKHFFLNTVLEEIHSGYSHLIDEARQHPELLWDPNGFVARYGEDAEALSHALQEVYLGCENRLRDLVEQSGAGKTVPTYHFRQWFLTHIAGESIRRDDYDLPPEMMTRVNQMLAEVVRENRRPVEQYRTKLKDYIRRTRFSQYRPQLENLSSDFLDMLAWFGRKKVALRDLKPENLFVAGNPEEYPAFLNDTGKFTIGLIDVETAVVFDAEDPRRIGQPQLAGTPLYATPTHLMDNALLLDIYKDLPTIFHLQDWFATIAILFRIVCGENLFGTTAHVFPEILKRLKTLDYDSPKLQEEVARIQRLFWNSAVAEFNANMTRCESMLSLVEVAVPAEFSGEFVSALKAEIGETDKIISRALTDQTFFNSDEKRRILKEASADKIGHMKNKLVQEAGNGQSGQTQVLLYFEILEKMKLRLEAKHRALANLMSPKSTLPLHQLLECMFQKVFEAMYLPAWPELSPRLYGSSAFLTADIATYQATM